jgi:hypothetical protein
LILCSLQIVLPWNKKVNDNRKIFFKGEWLEWLELSEIKKYYKHGKFIIIEKTDMNQKKK